MSKRNMTASQASFAQTVHADIQRSVFRRPSTLKTTFSCGKLVPIYIDEVLPGDTRKIDVSAVARLTTPIFPTMDNLYLEFYAFFVPNRLVWDGWEELNGENKTSAWVPAEAPALVPQFDFASSFALGSDIVEPGFLGDYYGLPFMKDLGAESDNGYVVGMNLSTYPVSALPFRGYALIWNEWFRDENLQAPYVINKGNTEPGTSYVHYEPNSPLLVVNKFHDYFTSCLPAPLKGNSPLIPIELNQLIPVIASSTIQSGTFTTPMKLIRLSNSLPSAGSFYPLGVSSHTGSTPSNVMNLISDEGKASSPSSSTGDNDVGFVPGNLYADPRGLQINDTTISELRTLFQIQKLLERDARGGTRYIEMLKAHFGVDAGDYRLQRPEFLGHYTTMVGMQQVPQTSSTDATSPQGNVAAYSLTGVRDAVICNKTFAEHGFIHIFAVARQVKTYQNGCERFWFRKERFDFYYPELAHISEQPVYNKEIFAFGNSSAGNGVFGYQEAWADYRYKPNRLSGQMRSEVENSLDVWHYADSYVTAPSLSSDWMFDNSATNVDRTLAVSSDDNDQIRMDVSFNDIATRPMPVFSIPGLVDHF